MSTEAPINTEVDAVQKQLADVDLTNKDQSEETRETPSTQTSSVAASLREKPSTPQKTPIVDPAGSITLPTPAELTSDQQSKYDALLEMAKGWKELTCPTAKDKSGPLADDEIMWLSRECLLRYLRATKWVTADAAKRILGTMVWRREYGVDTFTADHLSPENETGKQVILGYDIGGRPCQYLNPGRQNTEPSPRQVQHLVYMVERAVDTMLPTQETLALLVNFKSSKSRSNTAPGIGQGREVLNILQTHYPERLGRALVINMPWVVSGFFKLIMPFIDPVTKDKLKFNQDMRQHVPPEQLWTEYGGDLAFDYDHDVYWPALTSLCDERRAERRQRWIKAGKNYGESEAYMKGANVASIYQAAEPAVAEPTKEPEAELGEPGQAL
ncbi:CRAL/TRIO domain-containing protein [Phlyctema vagabunda]|uniref:CRAL/TRIO domain-containing protein n=1 Tax=Phlyctema vagabunda TaxID=108571 RepID=A0ABR4PJI5_9HELO